MPAKAPSVRQKSPVKRRRIEVGSKGEKPIQRGRPISRSQSWTQTLAEAKPEKDKTSASHNGMSTRLEDVLSERHIQQTPPPPLVQTSYNSRAVWGIGLAFVLLIFSAGSLAAWYYHPWTYQAAAPSPKPTPYRLIIPTRLPDVQRLNQLSVGQASEAASAVSSTQSAQAYRATLSAKTLPELASALHEQISQLSKQGIKTETVSHYEQLATTEVIQGETDQAKQNFIDGLQLAQELQAVHDYYH